MKRLMLVAMVTVAASNVLAIDMRLSDVAETEVEMQCADGDPGDVANALVKAAALSSYESLKSKEVPAFMDRYTKATYMPMIIEEENAAFSGTLGALRIDFDNRLAKAGKTINQLDGVFIDAMSLLDRAESRIRTRVLIISTLNLLLENINAVLQEKPIDLSMDLAADAIKNCRYAEALKFIGNARSVMAEADPAFRKFDDTAARRALYDPTELFEKYRELFK